LTFFAVAAAAIVALTVRMVTAQKQNERNVPTFNGAFSTLSPTHAPSASPAPTLLNVTDCPMFNLEGTPLIEGDPYRHQAVYDFLSIFGASDLGDDVRSFDICSAENLAVWWLSAELSDQFATEGIGIDPAYGLERMVMVTIYLLMNGPGWSNRTNWLGNVTHCEWAGVQCDFGNVVSLVLMFEGLHGPIPSAIGYLFELETLILSSNVIEGTLPSEIGSMTELSESSGCACNFCCLTISSWFTSIVMFFPRSSGYKSQLPHRLCSL